MVFKRKISAELSSYLCFLHQEHKVMISELCQHFKGVSCTTIYCHAKKSVEMHSKTSKQHKNMGRPKKLSARDKRHIMRAVATLREVDRNFSSKRIKLEAGVGSVSDCTVRRYLNREGLFHLQSWKKGLMSKADMRKRVKFARTMLKEYPENVWKNGISFYLDGTSFVHKTNPSDQARASKGRVWRRRSEGLKQGFTSKGKKVGHGGKVYLKVYLMVAISYGHGVIKFEQYEKMNGAYMKSFIRRKCNKMFSNAGKGQTFFQDGDPSQNCAAALESMAKCGAICLKIPARSPDLNPIENLFHLINNQLSVDAKEQNIQHETYDQFSKRVKHTLQNYSKETIDSLIDSMHNRMKMVVNSKGNT